MGFVTFKSRSSPLSRRAVCPKVYKKTADADWRELSRVRVREVRESHGSDPSMALLEAAMGLQSNSASADGSSVTQLRCVRAEDFTDSLLPQIGDAIRIEIPRATGKQNPGNNDLCIFEGVVYSIIPEAWPAGESISYTVYGAAKLLDAKIISGRYVETSEGQEILLRAEECVFNEWGVGNRCDGSTDDASNLLFSGKSDAQFWTLADMVRYVVSRYAGDAWLNFSAADDIAAFDEFSIAPPDVRIEGLTPVEALEDLLGRIGFSFAILPAERYDPNRLLVFRKGGGVFTGGKKFRLQASSHSTDGCAALETQNSEINRFSVALDSSDVVDQIIATGSPDLAVAAWELEPGWDTDLEETATADNCVKPTRYNSNSDWDTYREVHRLWVFNEDKGADIQSNFPPAAQWYRRRRKLIQQWPTSGGMKGCLRVWVMKDDNQWQRYEGPVRILSDCIGVYFELVEVPEYNGNFGFSAVKVEAAVETDSRLTVTVGDTASLDRPAVTRTVRCPDYLRVYNADEGSFIYDDTERLTAYATEKLAAVSKIARAASVTAPFFTARFLVGDCISSIDGREVSLGESEFLPFVGAVRWRFGDAESTEILVEDERFELAR